MVFREQFPSGERKDDRFLPDPPSKPSKPPVPSHSNLGGSPGLVTSTGGLYGVQKTLLVPFFDARSQHTALWMIDSNNFDTEEDAFYYFMSPDISMARAVTVHQVAVIYREIGECQFTIGIIIYNRRDDKFIFKERIVNITNDISPIVDIVNTPFPDNKLHTIYADLNISGERPQVYLKRSKDSGPLSVQSITLAGHRDIPQLM